MEEWIVQRSWATGPDGYVLGAVPVCVIPKMDGETICLLPPLFWVMRFPIVLLIFWDHLGSFDR